MVIINFAMIVNIKSVRALKVASAKLNTMTIGEKIRMLRKDRGWSQIDLEVREGTRAAEGIYPGHVRGSL
jgi:hypothetical protein